MSVVVVVSPTPNRSLRPHSARPAQVYKSSLIPHASLYTYSSHSSLASVRSSSHGRRPSPVKPSSNVSRSSSPPPVMEGVALYTAVLPAGSPPPPPPPVGGEYSSDADERSSSSPKRALRRIRGSVSESNSTMLASDDDECVLLASVSPLRRQRRNSAQLHHPRQLRSSPKSAYFEDAAMAERRENRIVAFQQAVFVGRGSPPPPLTGSTDGEDNEQGGALLNGGEVEDDHEDNDKSDAWEDGDVKGEDDHENNDKSDAWENGDVKGKDRVLAKSGRKVTPWATPRAASYTTERAESPQLVDPDESPQLADTNESPQLVDTDESRQSVETDDDDDSGDEVFEDASEIPLAKSPSPVDPMLGIKAHAAGESHPAPAPTKTSDEEQKRAILIYQPPNPTITASPPSTSDTTTTTSHKPPPLLPALKLIPATPQALSSSAEKEKQLGYPPLLTRKPTTATITTTAESILECEETNGDAPPVRPSLARATDSVRGSKLHPWWRPKRGDDRLAPDAALPVGFGDKDLRRASTEPSPRDSGRVVRRIKGTRFVVEFVGWKRIGGAVGVALRRKKGKGGKRDDS